MTNLTVQPIGNELRVDSRLVAEQLGLAHASFKRTIQKYQDRLEAKGKVCSEIAPSQSLDGRGTGEVYYLLNERQSIFLMTLSRNTDKVVEAKDRLEDAFNYAKQAIKGLAPEAGQAQLMPVEIQLQITDKIMELQERLAEYQPRLAQTLTDHWVNSLVGQRSLPSAAASPELKGAVEIAVEMGYPQATHPSTRIKLGKYLASSSVGSTASKERRICNGTMQPINCYPDNPETRAAIRQFFGD